MDFADDVLNSLTAHIAVLDEKGVIIAVNDAWNRFAEANGAPTSYVGADYVAVCECAAPQDETAKAALEGLRAVMSGETSAFLLEYPCHSPDVERWFSLRVTRTSGSRTVFVVAHEDITARKKIERELESALARERMLARTDDLTAAFNRRHFFDLAQHELAMARRYQQPLAVILFDVDHFKRINDTAGHDAGDEVLRRVADVVRTHLREADVFARYGGEEFIILLPRTTASEAAVVAEQIRNTIRSVTISSGVAELLAADDDSVDWLISRADNALYLAKQQGRNRTILADAAARPRAE